MSNRSMSALRVGMIILLVLLGIGLLGRTGIMGDWGYSLFGSMGMILMWLIPVGLIALTFLGIGRFLQARSSRLPRTERVCPQCRKSVQPDWQICPHCGTSLQ